jgi:hypothetical protein
VIQSGYSKGTIRSDIQYLVVSVTAEAAQSSTYVCGRIFAWAQKGTNSAQGVKFRAQLPDNSVYVQPRPTGVIAPRRALDSIYSPFPTISETTAVWAVRLAAVTAWV